MSSSGRGTGTGIASGSYMLAYGSGASQGSCGPPKLIQQNHGSSWS